MSEKTNIEWASHTASPWFGCSKVSAGCTNCYAEALTLQKKWAGWGDGSPRVRSKGFWTEAYRLNRKAEGALERPRMFTSVMDWLDPQAPIEWLHDFLTVVLDCQNLDWLLLTKRPELFIGRLTQAMKWNEDHNGPQGLHQWILDWVSGYWNPSNIWFGVTVENQAMADKRIPELLKIPARVRWLSVEPLLEQTNIAHWFWEYQGEDRKRCESNMIGWVVVGAESGRNRRDCGVGPIVNITQQCKSAGVRCFVKQDCAILPGQQGRIPDEIWKIKEYPTL